MHSYLDALCIIYILQIKFGVLGNGLLLYLYGYNLFTSQKTRSIDMIFINLAFSNILLIFFRGVPFTIQICIQNVFLDDIGCKIIIYMQRVSRGLSLCTACLLSFFQAITITSCSSKWKKIKGRALQYIVPSCIFIWILNLLVDMAVPFFVTGLSNSTTNMLYLNLGYCSISRHVLTTSKIVIWKSLYDAVLVGFMAITSGYIILVLYRHHQKVQGVYVNRLTPIASAETRVTKVILILMSIFVFFYSVSSILIIMMDHAKDANQWVIFVSVFLTLSYPTFSPYISISSDSQISSCFNIKRMRKVIQTN